MDYRKIKGKAIGEDGYGMKHEENDDGMDIDFQEKEKTMADNNLSGDERHICNEIVDKTNPSDINSIDDLKKIIYSTYSKSIDRSKQEKKKERKKLKNIMNLLIYLQMKKVELKLNYFNDFEKMIHYEKQQIKTLESQLIGDKIHLAMKKFELTNLSQKLKDSIKLQGQDYLEHKESGMLNKADRFSIDVSNKVIELN